MAGIAVDESRLPATPAVPPLILKSLSQKTEAFLHLMFFIDWLMVALPWDESRLPATPAVPPLILKSLIPITLINWSI